LACAAGQTLWANAGTRAALIGGAGFTPMWLRRTVMGLPPKGTHAHSLVQLCMALGLGELGAFRAYAEQYPDDCLLLVDTVDTLDSGVPNAIKVFEELRRKGYRPVGIRLDSGDLAYLAIQAAKQLDEAGFEDTSIVLSSDLDELVIWQIITQIGRGSAALRGGCRRKMIKPAGLWRGHAADHLVGRAGAGRRLQAGGSPGRTATGHRRSRSRDASQDAQPRHQALWRLYDRRGKATADLMTLDDEEPRAGRP
jgi:nicotinate phosphoribosyltransferase